MKLAWFVLRPYALILIYFSRAWLKRADKTQELNQFRDGVPGVVCLLCVLLLPTIVYAIRFLGFNMSFWVAAGGLTFCYFAAIHKAPRSEALANIYERASAEVDMVTPDRYFRMGFKYLAITFARAAIAIEAMALICNTLSAHTPGSPLYHQ